MRKALISIDNHFVRMPDGEFKSLNIVDRFFWNRYLDYFDTITVLVRTEDVEYSPEYDRYHPVSHPKVEIIPLPMFKSIKQLVSNRKNIFDVVKTVVSSDDFDISILRLPSLLGYILFHFLRRAKTNKPVGVEVVADMSVVSKYSSSFSKVKTYIFHKLLKFYVYKADGAAYVTKEALQLKYPIKKDAITNNYSSIDLNHSYFYQKSKEELDLTNKIVKLIHVSTLNSTAKGHEIFIKTIKKLRNNGYKVEGVIVGGGSQKEYYMNYAKEHCVDMHINFTGSVSDKVELRNLYIEADILLFPSEFEGLPRTVIEAMACSLPVVASNVGGIPELLGSEYVGDPYDSSFYYRKIIDLIEHPNVVIEVSKYNHFQALSYESTNLQKNRNEFFNELLESGQK